MHMEKKDGSRVRGEGVCVFVSVCVSVCVCFCVFVIMFVYVCRGVCVCLCVCVYVSCGLLQGRYWSAKRFYCGVL